jgi:hypothetical protein
MEGSKGRFLEKAAQKLSGNCAGGVETSTAQVNKVFLLLFVHKKKPLPCSASLTPCPP